MGEQNGFGTLRKKRSVPGRGGGELITVRLTVYALPQNETDFPWAVRQWASGGEMGEKGKQKKIIKYLRSRGGGIRGNQRIGKGKEDGGRCPGRRGLDFRMVLAKNLTPLPIGRGPPGTIFSPDGRRGLLGDYGYDFRKGEGKKGPERNHSRLHATPSGSAVFHASRRELRGSMRGSATRGA